jgi:hypothetical protein
MVTQEVFMTSRTKNNFYQKLLQGRQLLAGFVSFHKYIYTMYFKRKLASFDETARRLGYAPERVSGRSRFR